jgi:hypothetical protein
MHAIRNLLIGIDKLDLRGLDVGDPASNQT